MKDVPKMTAGFKKFIFDNIMLADQLTTQSAVDYVTDHLTNSLNVYYNHLHDSNMIVPHTKLGNYNGLFAKGIQNDVYKKLHIASMGTRYEKRMEYCIVGHAAIIVFPSLPM